MLNADQLKGDTMRECKLCPRQCNIDRDEKIGFCGENSTVRVARIAPHMFEEPPISGTRGSGTVFFSGCPLHCVFCQNKDISRVGGAGKEMSSDELYAEIVKLLETGVHNLNLVTATQFVPQIVPVLKKLKANGDLCVPVVYNSSGYEKVETLKMLDGLVDIYLPDFKYFSPELAKKYSGAPDYPEVARAAIAEMFRQVGKYEYFEQEPSLLKKGLVIRHLVLPACRQDSINALRELSSFLPVEEVLLSLMSQYTPEFALDTPYKELHRKLTSFEYSSVVEEAERLGFDGFIQSKSSANAQYTPDFKQK